MPNTSWSSDDAASTVEFILAEQCIARYWNSNEELPPLAMSSDGPRLLLPPRQPHVTGRPFGTVTVADGAIYEQRLVHVSDLGRADLTLRHPLPVCLFIANGVVTAFSHDIDEMGIGDTESEALDDFKAGVAAAYDLLKSEQRNLGPLQQRHWQFLSRTIEQA